MAAGCAPKKSTVMALFLVVLLFVGVGLSSAEVYKVGDDAGWTIRGNPMPNYTAWASTKTFRVGDIILFVYNKQFHNVLKVSHSNYRACNSSSPLATYATGNDSIPIKNPGHHYFICGFPGHCAIGQKVLIDVPKSSAALTPSSPPSFSPSPGGQPGNYAPARAGGVGGLALVLCAMGAVSAFILP